MAIKTYNCAYCGKEFTANRNQQRDSKFYCSVQCQTLGRKNRVTITCETCGKEFQVRQARANKYNVRFCSMKCKSEAGWVKLTCQQCGKTVDVRKCFAESPKYTGKFCSYTCAMTWQKGPNHPNWQGGHIKWRGTNWRTQCSKARKRDGYKCQSCGVTEDELGKALDVHHKTPWRKFNNDWKRANRLNNLISLCPHCHTTIERVKKASPHTHTIL